MRRAILVCALGALALAWSAGAAEERGATFETDGVTIWYEVTGGGSGTPLVLVNGGPGFDHAYMHTGAWERLGRDRPVVFYDQRGNGRAGALAPGQACGLAEQIADLEALRAHLGYESMELLGHSWGGYLAMAYAALHPERIAHLMIVDSAAPKIQDTAFMFDRFYPETVAREAALAFAVELGDPQAIAKDLDEYLTMLFYDPAKRDAFLKRARAGEFAYSQAVNRAVWSDLQRFDLNPEIAKFRFPTLVVTGRYDFNVAPSVAWGIHRGIPGSELAVFEKSGHLPQVEEEDAFVARLTEFLARESAP